VASTIAQPQLRRRRYQRDRSCSPELLAMKTRTSPRSLQSVQASAHAVQRAGFGVVGGSGQQPAVWKFVSLGSVFP